MLKRLTAALISAILILAFAGVTAIPADTDFMKGTVYLTYDVPEGVELEISGIRYMPIDVASKPLSLTYSASGVETAGSIIRINGEELCKLESNGTAEIPQSLLTEGENELTLVLISGKGTVYDDAWTYGTFNLDDITLESFVLKGAAGNTVPLKMKKYLPVEGGNGTTVSVGNYDGKAVDIGDGWVASTGLGGSTPERPVMLGFVFEPSQASDVAAFEVDTTRLPDGVNMIKFFDTKTGSYLDKTESIIVCNNAPETLLPFKNGDTLEEGSVIEWTVDDNAAGISGYTVKLDEKVVKTLKRAGKVEVSLDSVAPGRHTLYTLATDKAGNTRYTFGFFNVAERTVAKPVVTDGTVSSDNTLYGVKLADNINMYVNTAGEFANRGLRSEYEQLAAFSKLGTVTTAAAGNTVPIQSFVVDVTGQTGEAVISCSTETGNYAQYDVSVWNYTTSAWDVLETAQSGQSASVKADLSIYSADGKMRVNLYPHFTGNGSDTMLWFTDPQYYSRYEDLYGEYEAVMDYIISMYGEGKIAYAAFTGDIIDQISPAEEGEKEYAFASGMHEKIDSAGIPNGMVAGNHDVGHKTLDYSYYLKYFGASRYNGFEWYGGSVDDNINHFDLITVGGYDFCMLYIGYGMEASAETAAWASAVLEMYGNYNAVICTHEYILPSGKWSAENSQKLWENIVVPNDNVLMVLCGHNEGVCNQLRRVGDSDRYVLEILHDYQFAETGTEPKHTENGMTCDGESFLRLMTFTEAGQMIMSTYSPFNKLSAYYASYEENYVYPLELNMDGRTITTTSFYVGFGATVSDGTGDFDGYYSQNEGGEISAITAVKTKVSVYDTPDNPKKYVPDTTVADTPWYDGVEATLERSDDPAVPSSDVAVIALDLLPHNGDNVVKTSGSDGYEIVYNDNGSVSVTLTGSDYGWVTLYCKTPERVSLYENPYIYFSVTAGDNVKWNLCLLNSQSQVYSFSQQLYERFGYPKFCKPSDITGSWHGYMDMTGLFAEKALTGGIYLVAAAAGETITVNYMFVGKPVGNTVTFVADEDSQRTVSVPEGGTADDIGAPYAIGKTFSHWENEKEPGKAVEFPLNVTEDMKLVAVYTDNAGGSAVVYESTEVSLAEVTDVIVTPDPETSGDVSVGNGGGSGNGWLWAVAAAAVLVSAIVMFMVIRMKKKQ